jgi:hypothetical protein
VLSARVGKLSNELASYRTPEPPKTAEVTTEGEYTNVTEGDDGGNSPAAPTTPDAPITSAAPVAPANSPKMLKTGTPTYVNEYDSTNVLKSTIAIQKFDVVFKTVTDPVTGVGLINADITVNGYCSKRFDESTEKITRGIVYNVIGPDGKQVYQGVLVTPEIGLNDKFNVSGEIPFAFEENKTYKIEFEKDIMI